MNVIRTIFRPKVSVRCTCWASKNSQLRRVYNVCFVQIFQPRKRDKPEVVFHLQHRQRSAIWRAPGDRKYAVIIIKFLPSSPPLSRGSGQGWGSGTSATNDSTAAAKQQWHQRKQFHLK